MHVNVSVYIWSKQLLIWLLSPTVHVFVCVFFYAYSCTKQLTQKLEVCVVHSVGVYSLWSEWRMSVVKSVQQSTGCGLKRCQFHRPASVPQDMHLCQPQMRRNPYCTLGSKFYSDNQAERKRAQKAVNVFRPLLLQPYFCASLSSAAHIARIQGAERIVSLPFSVNHAQWDTSNRDACYLKWWERGVWLILVLVQSQSSLCLHVRQQYGSTVCFLAAEPVHTFQQQTSSNCKLLWSSPARVCVSLKGGKIRKGV